MAMMNSCFLHNHDNWYLCSLKIRYYACAFHEECHFRIGSQYASTLKMLKFMYWSSNSIDEEILKIC